MSTLIAIAAITTLAGFVYHHLPKDRPGKLFRLAQFRPAAPLAGIFDDDTSPSAREERPEAVAIQTEAAQSSNRALD